MGTRIFHNSDEYRAAMKKHGQSECECFSGVNMSTGKANGENLIKYATLEERTRVKQHMVRINDHRNKHSSKMTAEAKIQWDRQCTRERKLVQSQAIAHWKHLRQLDVECPKSVQADAVEQRQRKSKKNVSFASRSRSRGTKRQEAAEKAFPEEAASSERPHLSAKEALKAAYRAVRAARNEIRLDKKRAEDAVDKVSEEGSASDEDESSLAEVDAVEVKSGGAGMSPTETPKTHKSCTNIMCESCELPRDVWDDGVPTHLTREMQDDAFVAIGRPESDGVERSTVAEEVTKLGLSEEEVEEITPKYEDEYPKPQPHQQREPKGKSGGQEKGNKRPLQGFRRQFSAYVGSQ